MKNLIILFVTFLMLSCNRDTNKRKVFVHFSNDNTYVSTMFYCDSVHMENPNKAIVFLDGSKTIIYAKDILVGSTY